MCIYISDVESIQPIACVKQLDPTVMAWNKGHVLS